MDTFFVFVTFFLVWKHFLTLTTVGLKACFFWLMCLFLQSLKGLKVWNHNFFWDSFMNLAVGKHSSTLFFVSLVSTATGVQIEVSKLTVIFLPSIISSRLSLSIYSCSLVCSNIFHLKFVSKVYVKQA